MAAKTRKAPRRFRRKGTRKMSKGASDWKNKMMEVYREMKKNDPKTKLGDAMREAGKRKREGRL